MSLIDPRTVALWLFDEPATSLRPVDASGHLSSLSPGATNAMPDVDDAIAGSGRVFDPSLVTGLEVEDTAGDLAALTRDATMIALIALDVDGQDAAGTPGTIVQVGDRDSELVNLGLRVSVTDASARTCRLQLFWQTEAGSDVADVGVLFEWPSVEPELLVCAVREAVDGELVCRYRINGESLEGNAHAVDVGADTDPLVLVGVGVDGGYTDYLAGTIDLLEVLDEALCDEELEQLWLRLAVDIPAGITSMRRLLPPGGYSTDEESIVGREVAIYGAMLGVARNLARRFRDYLQPRRAWGEVLEQWEEMTRQPPKPGDWLARRRARVGGVLQTVLGYSLDAVKYQLEELFGLDSADIEILEYANTFEIDFSDAELLGGDVRIDGAGGWQTDASSVLAGHQTWAGAAIDGSYPDGDGRMLWTLVASEGSQVWGRVKDNAQQDESLAGVVVGRRDSPDYLVVGILYNGSGQRVGSWRSTTGVVTDHGAWGGAEIYVRLLHDGAGAFTFRWGANADADAGSVAVTGPVDPQWAGFQAVCLSSPLSPDFDFDDLTIYAPRGHQRYNWHAYRDPGLPGEYDIAGANLVVQRVKPAHTHASATATRALECDSEDSLCDQQPLGI